MPTFHHSLSGTTPGEAWSFNVHTTGAGTLAAAQAGWVAAVNSFWSGAFDDLVAPAVVATEAATASLDPVTGKQVSRLANDLNLPGTGQGEMMPFQCATSVSWKTDLATRAGQGRIYLPPLSVNAITAGRLSSSAQAGVVSSVEAMWGALNTAGLQVVIYSRETKNTTVVTRGNVGNVIDTQRRRRNKLIELRLPFSAP